MSQKREREKQEEVKEAIRENRAVNDKTHAERKREN